MASGKKLRKLVKSKKVPTAPKTGEYRHPDGDRRRRSGPSAKDAIRNKRLIQEFPGVPIPESDDYCP